MRLTFTLLPWTGDWPLDSSVDLTWLLLSRFGQVGDAGVRTQQHVAGVQRPLQEELLGLG